MARREADLDSMTGDERRAYKKRFEAMKAKVVQKLNRDFGRKLKGKAHMKDITEAIFTTTRRLQGFRSDMEYLKMFMEYRSSRRRQASTRDQRPFKPLVMPPSTQHAFERASKHQGALYTPKGVGNGRETGYGTRRDQ